MTSAPNVLTTKLHDLLYNQCFDNTFLFFFIYPTRSDKGKPYQYNMLRKNINVLFLHTVNDLPLI